MEKTKKKEEILFNSSTLVEKRNLNILVDGGNKIVSLNDHANATLACSAGFWMKKNNEDFIVTAGHCPDHFPSLFYVYSFQDNHLIGPINSRFIGSYDMDFIKKTNTNIMLRPVIRQFDMINLRFLQFLIVGSSEITSCGIHICKAGQITGISCGFVSAINSISYFYDRVLIRTIVVANMPNNDSDSGGSMFRYNGLNGQSNLADAVGIHIGRIPAIQAVGMPIN
ncbi:16702_t:CDS:2 [Gigaspora rosea]|nr:16702_t:CDS:2 [Gigaspora rosea]